VHNRVGVHRPSGFLVPTPRRAISLDGMFRTQRDVVDYGLARRAALMELFSGRASTMDVCDAHPYLLRAAKYHGEPSTTPCPVCKKGPLTHVTYTYGDAFKDTNGRVRATTELPAMEREYDEFMVYVVEVCRDCAWNHLVTSYVLGRAGLRARRAKQQSAQR
jgi:hypothetical protein